MKLTFLGSGSAFTVGDNNYQSNMFLENDAQQRLLIDCGSDVRWSLYEQGLTYRDLDSVYISHLHADHTGGLEWLAFTTKLDASCQKPTLYISQKLVDDLWDHVLAGGLNLFQNHRADLSTYFNVVPLKNPHSFTWSHLDISLVQTTHVVSGATIHPSYGLWFNVNGYNIFITTDTQFIPHQFMEFYQAADLIFHDCETSQAVSGVHAHYNELKTLDKTIKQKMWLYHYNPEPLPDAEKEHFKGFVKKGQIFDFSKLNTFKLKH